jgi:hypothetical protein
MIVDTREFPPVPSFETNFNNLVIVHGMFRALGQITDGSGLQVRSDIKQITRGLCLSPAIAPEGEHIVAFSTDEKRQTPLDLDHFDEEVQDWELSHPGSPSYAEKIVYRRLSPFFFGRSLEFNREDGQLYVYDDTGKSRVHIGTKASFSRVISPKMAA